MFICVAYIRRIIQYIRRICRIESMYGNNLQMIDYSFNHTSLKITRVCEREEQVSKPK